MIKTTRTKNRLYKVTLQVDRILECLQVKDHGESTIWHARLGHISRETMRMMANKNRVEVLPDLS